jgi:hypothetical protein
VDGSRKASCALMGSIHIAFSFSVCEISSVLSPLNSVARESGARPYVCHASLEV